MPSVLHIKKLLLSVLSITSSYKNNKSSTISRQLLIYVVSFSSVFALTQTIIQLKTNYDVGILEIDREFKQIELGYSNSLSQAIWEVYPEQIHNIATGIRSLPNVIMVRVEELVDETSSQTIELTTIGELDEKGYMSKAIPIRRIRDNKPFTLGTLYVHISLNELHQSILQQTFFLLGFQALKTFSVSIFILLIFYYLVTQHLIRMTEFSQRVGVDNLDERLDLNRPSKFDGDELWTMMNALNDASQNLAAIIDVEKSKQSLEQTLVQQSIKEKLQEEHRAEMEINAMELEQQNMILGKAMNDVKQAQQELVQSEKMAALGLLVRGVAHELNTPLGVLKMVQSLNIQNLDELALKHANNQLDQTDLEGFGKKQNEYNQLMSKNIERSINLVEAFKQVSDENASVQVKCFNLRDELSRCVSNTEIHSDTSQVVFEFLGDETIEITSSPDAFTKAMKQLLKNAVEHSGDKSSDKPLSIQISVDAIKQPNTEDYISIKVNNDGKGIDEDIVEKIFDPFFSTSPEANHVGLGLLIAFNAITSQMKGTIECISYQTGEICFELRLPIFLERSS